MLTKLQFTKKDYAILKHKAGSAIGKLGLAVCYDLRFPQLFRCLANQGAQIIAVPSAFTVKTGEAH